MYINLKTEKGRTFTQSLFLYFLNDKFDNSNSENKMHLMCLILSA